MVHLENCFCDKLNLIKLGTKVSFIMFRKEVNLPSNTAHVALKSLENSQNFERGHHGFSLEPNFINQYEYHPLFLFPAEDAVELTPKLLMEIDKPINLIIPDGTWRQAKKIHRREPLLESVQQVKITPSTKSIYPLRRQKFEEGLCTYEAMAQALKIIEGEETYRQVMINFEIFLNAHLTNRMIFEKEL